MFFVGVRSPRPVGLGDGSFGDSYRHPTSDVRSEDVSIVLQDVDYTHAYVPVWVHVGLCYRKDQVRKVQFERSRWSLDRHRQNKRIETSESKNGIQSIRTNIPSCWVTWCKDRVWCEDRSHDLWILRRTFYQLDLPIGQEGCTEHYDP